MEKIILIAVVVIFIIALFLNIYGDQQQNKRYRLLLYMQNKKIIFVNNPELNIKDECYRPSYFFLMHNNGTHPCDFDRTITIDYIHYSSQEDYFIESR